jgi:glucose-1-phosphate cytidylyltransferase
VDTGEDTLTGGRLKRIAEYVVQDDSFCFTYGHGVSDVSIGTLIEFHRSHNRWATVTAVRPPGRYGAIERAGQQVTGLVEKPRGDGGLINGGFFIPSPKCLDLIEGDTKSWECEPLTQLVEMGQLMAFEHQGFWQPMDTLRDKNRLEALWETSTAPWKIWS